MRTILTALIAFFPTKADGALAGLDYSDAERRSLAARSIAWRCSKCECTMAEVLPPRAAGGAGSSTEGERGSELQAMAAQAAKQLTLVAQPTALETPCASSGGGGADTGGDSGVPNETPGGSSSAALSSAASTSGNLGSEVAPRLGTEANGASLAGAPSTGLSPAGTPDTTLAQPPAASAAALPPMPGLPPESRAGSPGSTVLQARPLPQAGSASRQPDWLGLIALALVVAIAAILARKVGLFAGCEEEITSSESCSLNAFGGQ